VTDLEKLCAAIKAIHHDISWFSAAGGAVSSHDMAAMILAVKKRVDAVEDIVWREKQDG
jgi:hypothetical protein